MKTCLVVDDSTFDRRINALCAERVGFSVLEAENGEAALSLCQNKLPDYMLIDLEMAGMNGMELLSRLQKIKGIEKVTIIICTSHDHPSFVQQAHVNGATAYITKPITHHKLKDRLDDIELMNTIMSGKA